MLILDMLYRFEFQLMIELLTLLNSKYCATTCLGFIDWMMIILCAKHLIHKCSSYWDFNKGFQQCVWTHIRSKLLPRYFSIWDQIVHLGLPVPQNLNLKKSDALTWDLGVHLLLPVLLGLKSTKTWDLRVHLPLSRLPLLVKPELHLLQNLWRVPGGYQVRCVPGGWYDGDWPDDQLDTRESSLEQLHSLLVGFTLNTHLHHCHHHHHHRRHAIVIVLDILPFSRGSSPH